MNILLNALILSALLLPSGFQGDSGASGRGTSAPAPRFALAISTPEAVFKAGAEVRIKVVLTNTSAEQITVSRTDGLFNYQFDVKNAQGKPVDDGRYQRFRRGTLTRAERVQFDLPEGFSNILMFLDPGSSDEDEIAVTRLFDLAPGSYVIQVSRQYRRTDVPVMSNALTITVVP